MCFLSFSTSPLHALLVPAMGDSISEGTVVEWVKQPGEMVAVDDIVVILETDKVSVDVRAETSGILQTQLVAVDETVAVGAALAQIVPGDVDKVEKTEKKIEETVQVPVPSMGDSISEGTVVEWKVQVGDAVGEDEVMVVLETDKVSVDVRAPQSGIVRQQMAQIDEVVEVGAPLVALEPRTGMKREVAPTAASTTPDTAASVVPPGASEKAGGSTTPTSSEPGRNSGQDEGPERPQRREKMSRMRMRIAERLKESQNIAASLTTFQECDMGFLMDRRKEYKEAFQSQHGVKLGFMSAFIKASSEALMQVPAVNGSIDDATQEIIYRDFVDMSVAVSTPKGLVTPVMKDTHLMSIAEIELELSSLAERARNGQLTLEEMMGGNFTISNGGVFGSLMGTPILNRPQSAILGMHATKERPVVRNGEIMSRPMMYLALTYDHRLVDGREAVTCLKSIADQIETVEEWMDLGL